MKLISSIPLRRDGTRAAIEMNGESHEADADGVYDVPDHIAEHLLGTGHFTDADAVQENESEPKNDAAGNVLTRGDGKIVNLDDMTKAELVTFGKDSFGLEFKQNDSKPVVIAAIMAAVKADEDKAE